MKSKIKQMKQEQKEIALKIRTLKSTRKQCENGWVWGLASEQHTFRINHIVYCLLRGTAPEKIESKWKDPEDFTHKYVWKQAKERVEIIRKQFEIEADKELVGYEAICTDSK